MVVHNKIINKTWSTKIQENSAQRFVNNYFTYHLPKSLQDREKTHLFEQMLFISE